MAVQRPSSEEGSPVRQLRPGHRGAIPEHPATFAGPQKVKVQESPPYSHQSQGAVEGEHSFLAGLVRTWLMDLQNRYPNCGVDVNHTVFPWLVKYAAWSTARFQVRTTDKMTPYKIVNGVEYLSSICRFGGDGHGKAAKARHQSAEALDPRALGWQARPRQHQYHLDRVRRTFREVSSTIAGRSPGESLGDLARPGRGEPEHCT